MGDGSADSDQRCTFQFLISTGGYGPLGRFQNHATFREKGVNTALVRQTCFFSLYSPMLLGQL